MEKEDQAATASVGLLGGDPVAYQSRVRPDAIACIDAANGSYLNYAELDRRTAHGVGLLQTLIGASLGERIAILARSSVDQLVLALACQRAGAIFVPLNWRLTGAELAVLLRDCTPRILVVDEEFRAQADEALVGVEVERVLSTLGAEGLANLLDRSPVGAAAPERPDAPCTLLYTSGTTGRPKGVIITCSGAFHAALNFAFVGEVGPQAVVLCDVPLFHTVGLFAVSRTSLTMGATLVISDRFIPANTLARISDPELGVTHYFGVPQIASALSNDPAFAAADLSRLKALFTGGAPLPPSLIEAFQARGVTLVNGYGMSEAGTVLHMPLDPQMTRENPGCVGFPAPAVSVRIVGPDGHDTAKSADGELWIKGPAVTPGYWNQPAASEAAFVDGWFKTGDAARREANGMYRLIDRWKDMYISGGENVYPAEVEAAILAHPGVLDAGVVGAPDARWGECGVAFVVARGGVELEPAALIAHCAERLARYKLPTLIHFVNELPRNAAGKIRKDLLRQGLDGPVGA